MWGMELSEASSSPEIERPGFLGDGGAKAPSSNLAHWHVADVLDAERDSRASLSRQAQLPLTV